MPAGGPRLLLLLLILCWPQRAQAAVIHVDHALSITHDLSNEETLSYDGPRFSTRPAAHALLGSSTDWRSELRPLEDANVLRALKTYPVEHLTHSLFTKGFAGRLNPLLVRLARRLKTASGVAADAADRLVTHTMLPMRDGVKLSTYIVLTSKHRNGLAKAPTMMSRSPYGPTSDQLADIFMLTKGWAVVIQDQRGTYKSEGEFSMWHDDGNDGVDTMEWISKMPWSNGEVYSLGASADGCGSAAMIMAQPPPKRLKGQLLMWASADGHETSFPGGAFREGLITGWMTIMSPMTKGASLKRTLPEILAHERLSDWWNPVRIHGHYGNVRWPTIHIVGFSDIFAGHQIEMFNGIVEHSRGAHEHTLIVGPLGHCYLRNSNWGLAIQEDRAILRGFGYASESWGDSKPRSNPLRDTMDRVNLYVMGSTKRVGHFWTSLPAWPSFEPKRLYLTQRKSLMYAGAPLSSSPASLASSIGSAVFPYTYDPKDSAKTKGGNNLILAMLGFGCGLEDQRELETRRDVLLFDSEVFTEKTAIVGKVSAVMYFSTDRNDTDIHVSLNDVHPDGTSLLLRSGLRRLRYRDSTPDATVEKRAVPGEVYRVEVNMWYTAYVLAPGHRLRVTVTSSNSPYYAKNDGAGKDPLGWKARLAARNALHVSPTRASYVEIPVVEMSSIPPNEKF